jgi:hypothetical protein
MWLTPADIAEIQLAIEGSETFAPEQATKILARQVKNLIAKEQESVLSRSFFTDWRSILIALPCIIIVLSFFALRYCYPFAVLLGETLKNGIKNS